MGSRWKDLAPRSFTYFPNLRAIALSSLLQSYGISLHPHGRHQVFEVSFAKTGSIEEIAAECRSSCRTVHVETE